MTPNQQFLVAMAAAITALLGTLARWLVPIIKDRLTAGRGAAKLPTYRELVEEVQMLKEEFAQHKQAESNVFSDAARQWPGEYNPPRFDPDDLAVLIPSGVVPRAWRKPRLINGK